MVPSQRPLPLEFQVIAVHGTRDEKPAAEGASAKWWDTTSPFAKMLRQKIKDAINIEPQWNAFGWSGDNTLEQRQVASRALAEFLLQSTITNAGNISLTVLIGHSHGGNVIRDCLQHLPASIKSSILFCVSIGTPFLNIDTPPHPVKWLSITSSVDEVTNLFDFISSQNFTSSVNRFLINEQLPSPLAAKSRRHKPCRSAGAQVLVVAGLIAIGLFVAADALGLLLAWSDDPRGDLPFLAFALFVLGLVALLCLSSLYILAAAFAHLVANSASPVGLVSRRIVRWIPEKTKRIILNRLLEIYVRRKLYGDPEGKVSAVTLQPWPNIGQLVEVPDEVEKELEGITGAGLLRTITKLKLAARDSMQTSKRFGEIRLEWDELTHTAYFRSNGFSDWATSMLCVGLKSLDLRAIWLDSWSQLPTGLDKYWNIFDYAISKVVHDAATPAHNREQYLRVIQMDPSIVVSWMVRDGRLAGREAEIISRAAAIWGDWHNEYRKNVAPPVTQLAEMKALVDEYIGICAR